MNENQMLKGVKFPAFAVMAMLGASPLPQVWLTPAVAQSQQTTVRGTVIDDLGEPVLGATVMVVGTTTGTITDIDGNFSLNVKPGAELQVSFVGYETQVVKAKNGMTITLAENSTLLGDVEVVAYGVQKKVTVTGAIASVKGDDLMQTPVSNVNNVLAGQLSGVTTIQTSGEPGMNATEIFVRGKATWDTATPLIQVDGVEREMWDIDPNEIESITVLKDASATAVFGVRGANGVVLITTKRGQEGKAKINVSTSFTALTPTKMIELADSYQYAQFHNQMGANDGRAPKFTDLVISKFKDGSDPIRFPSMDWTDYIMNDLIFQQQHNVNISGGNKLVKYFISAGYYSQGSLFEEFGKSWNYGYEYQRFNYRANLDIQATKTTTISMNLSGKVDDKDTPRTGQGSSGMIKAIYTATPFCSPGVIDGRYIANSNAPSDNLSGDVSNQLPFVGDSPMTYYAYQPGGFHYSNNNLSFDLVLDQKLDMVTKGLSFKVKGSYNTNYSLQQTITSQVATYTPVLQEDGKSIIYRKSGDNVEPSYSTAQSGKGRNWYAEASLSYHRQFGNHTVNALALYNQSKEYYPKTFSDLARTYVGFVGRVTYDYKSRYMAEVNFGYNGSENFAPGKRFGSFPAGSIGWNVSEEKWFEPMKEYISFFKLRGSVGLVGNDKIAGSNQRYMYTPDPYNVNQQALIERTGKDSGAFGYNFGVENGTVSKGAVEAQKNNPDVTWENALKQDYGFDLNLFNDRLRTNFDYFYEHRTDILVQNFTAPSIVGVTLPYSNLGETKSWGYEVSLNWNDKIGSDFRYWAKLNLSYNQNEIIEKYESPKAYAYEQEKGNRIGSRLLYNFWKYYEGPQTEAEYQQTFGKPFPTQLVKNLQPGDCVYVDTNGNGEIDPDDQVRAMGYTNDPEYICGLNLGFQWKQLSFSTQLTGAWNVTRVISGVFREPFASSAANNSETGGLLVYHIKNSWSAENPSQSAEYPRPTWDNAPQNYAESNLFEKNANYLRLKTMQLGYDFKGNWMKKLGMSQFQLSLSAYNLFTFTPYLWGDPEATASNSPSYPLQRTYTASLKVAF